jgi:ribosomal protein S8E
MLDFDLAAMYGVETKRLNEAVKRNAQRFEGDDFMFRLTKDEATQVSLRSQIVTMEIPIGDISEDDSLRSRSQIATLNKGRGSNTKYLPYAFTELGVAMLSSVLRSETAIKVNRNIMKAFVTYRHLVELPMAATYIELKKEIESVRKEVDEILADQNEINEDTRAQLDAISTALAELQSKEPREKPRRKIGFVQEDDDIAYGKLSCKKDRNQERYE